MNSLWYWYTTCRNCQNQGRLFLMKNITANRLYLHCEECEWGLYDPSQVDDRLAMFLTLNEDFEAEPASLADIEQAGWQAFARNKLER